MRSLSSNLPSLILALLLVLASPWPPAQALSPDGLALLAFKSAVTDDPLSALSAWSDADADPCGWPGITCANMSSSSAPPRVIGVAVAGKNLSGYIPSELGSLLFLRRLNLHGNRLSGPVPAALSNASSLHSLFLYDNSLTGEFPAALCDLPRLQNLDMSKNSLAGPLPLELRNCRELQRLLLSQNGFSGKLPAGIWPEMAGLEQLDLSSNTFSGSIPADLGRLPALSGTLNLSHNRFSGGVPPELGRLPATVSLDLRFNNLSGEIPQAGSLAGQGPTAFLNNPGLCGFPLQVPCRPPPLPTSPPPPTTASPIPTSPDQRQGLRTSLIVLISVADAAGVALIGIIVVYIYWKVKDKKGRRGHDGETGYCSCMLPHGGSEAAESEEESDEVADGKCSSSGGGGEGQLVAIDKNFSFELDELLRSSAYVLGKGGKGIVYKVVVGNGVPVAVRRLGGGGGGAELYREFAAEAAAVGKVRHANVVRLRAYYWSADEKLLITDFVNGGNLATALRGRSGQPSLSWSIRLRILKGAARGLAYLHECSPRKFVHGEVKPSNILLDSDHNAYISDFGLTRLIGIAGCTDASFPYPAAGIMGGALPYAKPALPDRPNHYRAPEARTPGTKPTQKWDVYSFGIVILEVLTGRPPEHASPSTSTSFSGSGEHVPETVRWVRQGFDDARPLSEMTDPVLLREAHAKKELISAFHVALGCTEPEPDQRPRMKAVSDSLDKIGS